MSTSFAHGQGYPTRFPRIPDREPEEPLHRHITRTLTRWIEDEHLPPGSMLPTEVALAQQFGVSRHTMRAGIDALVRGGRLERFRGKGTFVTHPRIQQSLARFYSVAGEMSARGAHLETIVLERGWLDSTHALAGAATVALGLEDVGSIGYLLRLRSVEGIPLLLEWVMFLAELCPALLSEPVAGEVDLAAAPFYETLAEHAGIVISAARETLHPVAVMGYEARLLDVPSRTPAFEVERVAYYEGRAVEWRHSLVRGDRYGYVVELNNPREESDLR
ncbi:MAG TPA: GntR family transcriptional regulator [Ktedonobacterales bacterium]